MYRIMACVSLMVRQFLLPNPFEPLGDTVSINLMDTNVPMAPIVLNWIAEPILHIISFMVTGFYYTRRVHDPAYGSFLYLLFYIIHVGLIYIMSYFKFTTVAIIIVISGYVIIQIGINIWRNRLYYRF